MKKYLVILIILIILIILYNIFRYCIQTEFKNLIKNRDNFTDVPLVTNTASGITTVTSYDVDDNNAIEKLATIAKDLKAGSNLEILSDLSIEGNGVFNLLPRGIIFAWNSAVAPPGWAICDGTQGTPNLKGRFILSSRVGRAINTFGGAENVILTIAPKSEIPSHRHSIINHLVETKTTGTAGQTGLRNFKVSNNTNTKANMWSYGDQTSLPEGGSSGKTLPHDNMPPYYVLTYIMKL